MKQGAWAAMGMLVGTLSGLVWQAPASWLAGGIQALSQERVQLRQPQGTVWHGSAQWVLASGPGGQDARALPQRQRVQLPTRGVVGVVVKEAEAVVRCLLMSPSPRP
jgi:hypothetical protein